MQHVENEKNKLLAKYKDLQEENLELKSKVIGLKNISYNNCALSANNGNDNIKSDSQLIDEKDYEIERLNRIIEELVKSNEEKVG